MNYEEMWKLLKRTVMEEYEMFCDDSRFSSISSEAQDIIRLMDKLEQAQRDYLENGGHWENDND